MRNVQLNKKNKKKNVEKTKSNVGFNPNNPKSDKNDDLVPGDLF